MTRRLKRHTPLSIGTIDRSRRSLKKQGLTIPYATRCAPSLSILEAP
ncbi:MAG: hypothetical protein KME42_13040 [Tildeniella nuda ZEHNDER 1965/U140]|nr:hypothetical protein [Tildeniella nuda ZEHNDER 1965/U140]